MEAQTHGHKTVALVLRWVARIWSIATIALVLAFIFGERGKGPGPRDLVLFLFFPVGICVGMVLAWWKERAGGIITVASLAVFYVLQYAMAGRFTKGPWFLAFAAPGFLFLLASWARMRPTRPVEAQPQHSH